MPRPSPTLVKRIRKKTKRLPRDLAAALRARPKVRTMWRRLGTKTRRQIIFLMIEHAKFKDRHQLINQFLQAIVETYKRVHSLS